MCIALLDSAPHAGATPAPTTTTLAVTSGGNAVTTVTSETVVTLTATVVAGNTPVTVGQVTFCDAAATYCTDIHIVGTAQLTSAGTATYKFRPGVGSHSYSAVFAGTPNGATAYAGSTSSAAALTVTGLWPSISTFAESPSGNTYNLTATVGGNDSTAPTGSVSYLETFNGNSVLGTATLGAGTAGVSFLNTSSPATSLGFESVAVGNFNGDGIPDLAAVNSCSDLTCDTGAVTILLGNGDGTFTATPTSPATGNFPYAIAVADFNGDGILDLAVTNTNAGIGGGGTVTVLLGNGDGTFTSVVGSPATGGGSFSIAVADFNGDGIPDLALLNNCGNIPVSCANGTVTVLLGNGDGTFTATATCPATGNDPLSIAVGDFNGDGNLDLAVANHCGNDINECPSEQSSTVTILIGDGKGNFTPAATTLTVDLAVTSVAVGDFNGDGILDLAVTSEFSNGSGELAVLLGNGNGTFTPVPTLFLTGSVPNSIVEGDFNGDGIPDLAVANEESSSVTVLLGDGTGNFTPAISSLRLLSQLRCGR